MPNRILQLKPVKKTYEVAYWSCGIDGKKHRHKIKAVAQKCIDFQIIPRPRKKTISERADRNKQILHVWLSGETAKQASIAANFSYDGTCGVIRHFCRKARNPNRYTDYGCGSDPDWHNRVRLNNKDDILYPVSAWTCEEIILREKAMTPTRLKAYKKALLKE